MGGRRQALIRATKELLAEDGYTATSPRDILARSGAGQGSLYHHFRGKSDLAAAALSEVSAEMLAEAEALLNASTDPLKAVLTWLTAPREALRGCRLGRLVAEPILDDAALTAPVADFFAQLQLLLTVRLGQAQQAETLSPHLHPAGLAAALIAVIQGGYVLARATNDPAAMTRAQAAAADLLRGAAPTVDPAQGNSIASPIDQGEQP